MTSMEEWHTEEDLLKERIKKKSPNHPVLKRFFGSTHDAIDAYNKVEEEIRKQS